MKKILAAAMALAGGVALAHVNAPDVGNSASSNVKELQQQAGVGGSAQQGQESLKGGRTFELEGTVSKAHKGKEISVARANAPTANLKITDRTAIYIDGKQASPKDLQEGMPVRTSFQLKGSEAIALRVDASSTAHGGAGAAGQQPKTEKPNR